MHAAAAIFSRSRTSQTVLSLVLALTGIVLRGRESSAAPPESRAPVSDPARSFAPPKTLAAASLTNLPLKSLGVGVFELGKVRLDKNQKTVTFPAALNQNAGAIEYFLVTSYGKTHESVLRTEAEPYHIHLALLLLGAPGAGTNAFPENHTATLPGDPVSIELNWRTGGKEVGRAADELVWNLETKSAMSQGNWVFNGSRVREGQFIAQSDGSIVSVMEDEYALINNPRPGRDNDKIWLVNSNGLPPLNTPMQVTIKLLPTR